MQSSADAAAAAAVENARECVTLLLERSALDARVSAGSVCERTLAIALQEEELSHRRAAAELERQAATRSSVSSFQ